MPICAFLHGLLMPNGSDRMQTRVQSCMMAHVASPLPVTTDPMLRLQECPHCVTAPRHSTTSQHHITANHSTAPCHSTIAQRCARGPHPGAGTELVHLYPPQPVSFQGQKYA